MANKIIQAYEMGLRIRYKDWDINFWIKKQSETNAIDEIGQLWGNNWGFDRNPEKWEIYTEAEAEQVTEPAKPKFDQERFEAMFRAVVASGRTESSEHDFLATKIYLNKLDAFYATKKGGENG